MRKYTHESPELNALLGKQVRLTFFDGDVVSGILEKDDWHKNCYHIRGSRRITFYKSHVTKIEIEGQQSWFEELGLPTEETD